MPGECAQRQMMAPAIYFNSMFGEVTSKSSDWKSFQRKNDIKWVDCNGLFFGHNPCDDMNSNNFLLIFDVARSLAPDQRVRVWIALM